MVRCDGMGNTPHTPAATVPHLGFKPRLRLRIALVLRRDLLKRRPNELAIHRVTSHAGILARAIIMASAGAKSRVRRLRAHPGQSRP
jgi:hypothetical protein